MKVILAGSRSFTPADYDDVRRVFLLSGYWYSEVVSGCAQGVDLLGERFAKEIGVPVKRFPADWDRHGRSAGYLRTVQMAKYADALVAVWDGSSKGTAHMIRIAREHQRLVYFQTLSPAETKRNSAQEPGEV